MPRQYLGAHEVNIPINDILTEYEKMFLPEVIDAIAKELLAETRSEAVNAPFENHTGNLRKSIHKQKSRFDKNMVIVSVSAPHAHLVEFGTGLRVDPVTGKASGHMPATPFLSSAAENVRSRLPEIIARALKK